MVHFGKQSLNYALHRPGFPPKFYTKLSTFIDVKGKKVLDVGSGPGVIALALAKRGATVVASDISSNQIEAAKKLAQQQGLEDKCTFTVATAEDTKQPKEEFDLVTAGTCWHWFDKPKACKEIQRVLKLGGLFVVAQYEYLAEPNSLASETEKLILKYNPEWPLPVANGINPEYIQELTNGGFEFEEMICFDHQQRFTHDAWLGRILTCNGVGSGSLSQEDINKFSKELIQLMKDEYPAEIIVKHRVFMVVVRKPGKVEPTQWYHVKYVTVKNITTNNKLVHRVNLHLAGEMPIDNTGYDLRIGPHAISEYWDSVENSIEFQVENMDSLKRLFNQPIVFFRGGVPKPSGVNFPDMIDDVDSTAEKQWTSHTQRS